MSDGHDVVARQARASAERKCAGIAIAEVGTRVIHELALRALMVSCGAERIRLLLPENRDPHQERHAVSVHRCSRLASSIQHAREAT